METLKSDKSVSKSLFTKKFIPLLSGSSLIVASILLVRSSPLTQLEQVLDTGELHVVSRNGPTTYYEGPNGLTGFEYSLSQNFAASLGVKLVIEDQADRNEVLNGVAKGRYHFAAAGITATDHQSNQLAFTSSYMQITQQLVFNSRLPAPLSINDLKGKEVLIVDDSFNSQRMQTLLAEFPQVEWRKVINAEIIDLLDMINNGEADYAVIDSNAYDLNRYSYPHAKLAFDVSDPQALAWAFKSGRDHSLLNAAQKYMSHIKQDGSLAKVTQQFFDQHIEEVTTGDAMVFAYRLENRLPQWADEMKKAATEFNLDWQLLAAVSYQESHWLADAESFTGVRGLMMLTKSTARDMGVNDREDPAQSIYGGAKYLRMLLDRLPERIQGEDRLNMALAAYNQGLGHLEDARVLTQRLGGDPCKWNDVRTHMPLLAKEQYYTQARHGYMRGWEPVKFVDNVRNYRKILAWHEQQEEVRLATSLNSRTRIDQAKATTPAINENHPRAAVSLPAHSVL